MFGLLSLLGVKAALIGTTVLGGGIAVKTMSNMDMAIEEREKRKSNEDYEDMIKKKKQIEVDLFNEGQQRENEAIKKNYEQMQVDKKDRELKEYNLVENVSLSRIDYTGIKAEGFNLLLGHDCNGFPVWGTDTNYIISGSPGCGKTRKLYPILLNYLVNNQGYVYLGDLKGTDFRMMKDCKNVVKYVDDLVNVAEVVKAFEEEYERRKELFNQVGAIDLEAYNKIAQYKLRHFLLLIDEYADISDCYKDRNGRPTGVYADIIRLSRKCRSFGGRIILATQRPSVDVICGSLKNNTTIVGMKCINGLNSNIMIGTEGCERLAKTEALSVIDGNLMKIFSYRITDERLSECISKLK